MTKLTTTKINYALSVTEESVKMDVALTLVAEATPAALRECLAGMGLFDLADPDDLEMSDDEVRDMAADYFGGSDAEELDDAILALRGSL